MRKLIVPIKGMHCRSCEILIENNLKKVENVKQVKINHKIGEAEVFFEECSPSTELIKKAVQEAGYSIGKNEPLTWLAKDKSVYSNLLDGAIILFIVYFIASRLGLFSIGVETEKTGLFVVLMVGLVAGISTCMALVGGLVLGLSARHAELHPEISALQKFRPHLYFNLGRILGFGILGGMIGLLGSAFKPSTNALGLMTIVVGGVMIFLGLKLIEIFPKLTNKSITLPKSIAKIFGISTEQKEYSHKGAMLTGALTFFLPCGFTQAMQLYAVNSGSFSQGALIMALFALGTAPGLLGIGGLASVFKGKRAKIFFATAGLAVIIFGWINITNGSQLLSFNKPQNNNTPAATSGEVQEIRMTQSGSGYSPNQFTVEKGKKVKWIINSTNPYSCASSIVMAKYGISKYLDKGENIIEFTPTEVGEVQFSCSMGMYRGVFKVIESKQVSTTTPDSASAKNTTQSASSCSMGGGCGGCGGGAKKNIDTTPTTAVKDSDEQLVNAQYTLQNDIVPNNFVVKKGIPVKFVIDVKESGQGCMSSIMIPGLYNSAQYLQGGSKIIMTFTPDKAGDFDITCAMGVPRGIITVT